MINNLKIKNFKSVGEEIDIELRPLTILLGPNGSGKSTILESIGLLSQSVGKQTIQTRKETTLKELIKAIRMTRTTEDIERLQYTASGIETQRNNNMIDIQDTINVFHKKDPEKWLTIEIDIKLNNEEIADIISISGGSIGKLNELFIYNHNKVRYIFNYSHENEFIQIIMIGDSVVAKSQYFLKEKRENSSSWDSFLEFPLVSSNSITSEGNRLTSLGANVILDEKTFDPNISQLTEDDSDYIIFTNISAKIVEIIKKYIKNRIFLISATRGEIEDKEIDESIDEGLLKLLGVGTNGQNLIPILSLIRGSNKYENIYDNINNWIQRFGLDKISAGWQGKDKLGSDYIDSELRVDLNLAMASQGSRQILSVIVQLFWSDPGSIIMIEEPEISIYSTSQRYIIELFAKAISQDRQIILTTHSEFFPLALKDVIRDGLLEREKIAIYRVNKYQNGSMVQRLNIDEEGNTQGWGIDVSE